MAEFLWEEPSEDCYIAALPDDVQQAPSASSAPTAAQWISNAIDIQTRAAQWRKVRDERVHEKVTEQAAIATKIAQENRVWREEEKKQKGGGPKEPYDPGPRICPECGKRTWDLMTLGNLRCMWHVESFMGKKEGQRQGEGERQ
jgi:hypothetical protein